MVVEDEVEAEGSVTKERIVGLCLDVVDEEDIRLLCLILMVLI